MISDFMGEWPRFLGSSIFVAPNATLIGTLTLHEDVSVWFNAVIRGDIAPIEIGRGTNIQDGTTIHTDKEHPSILGEDITVGHNCIIHGCTIQDGTLIGMGSVILSGAKIGRNCLIGAGSVVTGKLNVPDEMLVLGSPARIVKKLDRVAIEQCMDNSRRYVVKKNQYLSMGMGKFSEQQAD